MLKKNHQKYPYKLKLNFKSFTQGVKNTAILSFPDSQEVCRLQRLSVSLVLCAFGKLIPVYK